MKKVFVFILVLQITLFAKSQIIADHTIVNDFDKIPQIYRDEVKKMWLVIAGESHSLGYRAGLLFLENLYSEYPVSVVETGIPELFTTTNLRASRATWGDVENETGWVYGFGEEDWFRSELAKSRTKAGIKYCSDNNLTIGAMGFGWCWDESAMDEMAAYISATEEYIQYCSLNTIPTKIFFTTGTVDYYGGTEMGYVKHQAYETIRNHVKSNPSKILFDYADILCWDDAGNPTVANWNGHSYPDISPSNEEPVVNDYHISKAGALRLAKAMWWMLARIAGWNGVTVEIPVSGITLNGAQTIITDNGTLQLSATVAPATATNKNVIWSIASGGAYATISQTGLVTAVANGTSVARVTANDGTNIFGELTITITNQVIPVTGITVSGTQTIETDNGTSQLTATIAPANATNKTVTWSIISGGAYATISQTGLVMAVANGTAVARATANVGSEVFGEYVITVSGLVNLDAEIVQKIKIISNKYKITIEAPEAYLSARISLINLNGIAIETKILESNNCEFDISMLPSGIYFIIIKNQGISEVLRFALFTK